MSNEKQPLFGDKDFAASGDEGTGSKSSAGLGASGGESAGPGAIFHDSTQSPKAKAALYGFVGITIAMVIVALSLCIAEGVKTGQHGFLYFLIGLNLVGFIAIEILLIKFIRSGDLAKEKMWFLYFVGFCILLESIFTDVLVRN